MKKWIRSLNRHALALIFTLSTCTTSQALPPGELILDYVDIEAIDSHGDTLEDARDRARMEALRTALNRRGNREIDAKVRRTLAQRIDELVFIRDTTNAEPEDGKFYPTFDLRVDIGLIDEIIGEAGDEILPTISPYVVVGVGLGELPKSLAPMRAELSKAFNQYLRESFQKRGFTVSTATSSFERNLDRRCKDVSIRNSFLGDSMTDVNFLLYGCADIHDDEVREATMGGTAALIHLNLRFLSVADSSEVVINAKVEGIARNARQAVERAMKQVADVTVEKKAGHRIIDKWKKDLKNGFNYQLALCHYGGGKDWTPDARRVLSTKGKFVSAAKVLIVDEEGDEGVSKQRLYLYRYRANPGEFIYPPDFEIFLDEVRKSEPRLGSVHQGLRAAAGKLYVTFGDHNFCFMGGRRDNIDG